MRSRSGFVYAVIVALLGAFGISAWLAAQGRFLEAIATLGVATTLAWFVTRIPNRDDQNDNDADSL